MNRLRPSYEAMEREPENTALVRESARKIVLCLKTLKEYVAECDKRYPDERTFLPHERYLLLLRLAFVRVFRCFMKQYALAGRKFLLSVFFFVFIH